MADDDRVEITTFSLPEAVRPLHPVGPLVSSRSRGPPRRSRARGARNLTPLPATRASHLPPPPQYVYAIPPAPTHAGHRADGWNVEKWLKAVRVKVTAKGERGHIKLEDAETGELFAACPLPRDAPVSTAVEPVLDSSRYFVLRVEDEATRRHAFLGLGFRQRDDASDFKLAVQEHQARADREKEAVAARAEYERELAEKKREQEAAGITGPARLHDFSLKGTIHVAVPGSGGKKKQTNPETEKTAAIARLGAPIAPPPTVAPIAPPPLASAPPAIAAPLLTAAPPAEEGWASFDAPSDEGWADFQS